MTTHKFFKNVCLIAGMVMLTGCVSCGVTNRQN